MQNLKFLAKQLTQLPSRWYLHSGSRPLVFHHPQLPWNQLTQQLLKDLWYSGERWLQLVPTSSVCISQFKVVSEINTEGLRGGGGALWVLFTVQTSSLRTISHNILKQSECLQKMLKRLLCTNPDTIHICKLFSFLHMLSSTATRVDCTGCQYSRNASCGLELVVELQHLRRWHINSGWKIW